MCTTTSITAEAAIASVTIDSSLRDDTRLADDELAQDGPERSARSAMIHAYTRVLMDYNISGLFCPNIPPSRRPLEYTTSCSSTEAKMSTNRR